MQKVKKDFKYIYGPVSSWRLKKSLGIDPLSQKEKVCTFDCIYCQLGRTKIYTKERKTFVPEEKIIEEINSLPEIDIDYITFSGRGEPTLAKNISKIVDLIKNKRKEKIAVITNSSLLIKKEVRKDLLDVDFVLAKLDASCEEIFQKINRPAPEIKFNKLLKGIIKFKEEFKGKLALQIMFIDLNKNNANEIAKIAKEINPDEIQINTPLRPCKVSPLKKEFIYETMKFFKDFKCINVYDFRKKKVLPISKKKTLERRGKFFK